MRKRCGCMTDSGSGSSCRSPSDINRCLNGRREHLLNLVKSSLNRLGNSITQPSHVNSNRLKESGLNSISGGSSRNCCSNSTSSIASLQGGGGSRIGNCLCSSLTSGTSAHRQEQCRVKYVGRRCCQLSVNTNKIINLPTKRLTKKFFVCLTLRHEGIGLAIYNLFRPSIPSG